MRTLALALVLCLYAAASAQEISHNSPVHDHGDFRSPWQPGFHPYIEPQYFSGGGGYSGGFTGSVGLHYDERRFEIQANGNYGFSRKTNDNDQVPNEHGHTRGLEGLAFYRLRNWFIGGGATWGETAVTPYRKYSWAPEVSAGHAFFFHFFDIRIQGTYLRAVREYTDYPTMVRFTPGPGQPANSTYCICNNGVTGYGIDVLVSKSARGHVILHSSLSVIRFHETATDVYNLQLTAEQDTDRGHSARFAEGLQFRL